MMGQGVELGPATIASLLAVAIRLEAHAREFYEALAGQFENCPDAARFWRIMAADEACHENRLIEWGSSLCAERRSQPVDAAMLRTGGSLLGTSIADLLGEIRTLDDAYEMHMTWKAPKSTPSSASSSPSSPTRRASGPS